MSSLIGSVQERKPTTSNKANLAGKFDPATGFPAAQHRSQSIFARNKNARLTTPARPSSVPLVQTTTGSPTEGSIARSEHVVDPGSEEPDDWRQSMSYQNEKRVREMTDSERERERQDVIERFGPDVISLLNRVKQRREAQGQATPTAQEHTEVGPSEEARKGGPPLVAPIATTAPYVAEVLHTPQHASRPTSPLPSALRSSTPKPPRKIRFSTEPADVHVYESAPSSPKRRPLALLPPPDPSNPAENRLVFNSKPLSGKISSKSNRDHESLHVDLNDDPAACPSSFACANEETGTPEDIRRRYFPDEPANEPALEWMKPSSTSETDIQSGATRYDFEGNPIPFELQASLPTHLGLHHHGDDQDRAGYTLDELLLLSRSTVPAQRASMLGVLGKVLTRIPRSPTQDSARNQSTLHAGENDPDFIRMKILAVALEALPERGGVGVRAVDLLWRCLVAYPQSRTPANVPAEFQDDDFDISTLTPLPPILRQIAAHIHPTTQTLPATSLAQLLEILFHLASRTTRNRSNAIDIVGTNELIASVLHTFVTATSSPDPVAISFVTALARTSRAIAKEVVDKGIADTFLRFLVELPDDKLSRGSIDANAQSVSNQRPQPTVLPSVARMLLFETLKLYAVLGRYGLYAVTATTATEQFAVLGQYVLRGVLDDGQADQQIIVAYLSLMEVWIDCAVDPHKTSPPHDILWSQIVGWDWAAHVLQLRSRILTQAKDSSLESQAAEGDSQFMHLDSNPPSNAHRDWQDILPAIWHVLAAWLEGSTINAVRTGETEKRGVTHALQDVGTHLLEEQVITHAVRDSIELLRSTTLLDHHPDDKTEGKTAGVYGYYSAELVQLSFNVRILLAAVRLAQACMISHAGDGAARTIIPSVPSTTISPSSTTHLRVGGVLSESSLDAISKLCREIAVHPLWQRYTHNLLTPGVHALLRPLSTLLVTTSLLERRCNRPPDRKDWLVLACQTMTCLLPGDEGLGARLVEVIVQIATEDLIVRDWGWTGTPAEVWSSGGGLECIRPFLQLAMWRRDPPEDGEEDGGKGQAEILSPLVMTPRSIQEVTALDLPSTLVLTSSTNSKTSSSTAFRPGKVPGLPFHDDWCFVPLDALLHSGTSPVFKSLPSNWDHSEVEVVRATLLLARIVQMATTSRTTAAPPQETSMGMSREQVVFGCMKVFMLEHGQSSTHSSLGTASDSSMEVFRDEMVSSEMVHLLAPFRVCFDTHTALARSSQPPREPTNHSSANTGIPVPIDPSLASSGDATNSGSNATTSPTISTSVTPRVSLESIAIPYLGISTPFYQFYTDFLGLYDSISFGHATFGALLIPPLANAIYSPDYRKLLWGDYPQVVRLLDIEPDMVIGSDVKDWLYPVEKEGDIVGMYLKALGSGRVRGFLRWIAVHHVACNIWPDLQAPADEGGDAYEGQAKASRPYGPTPPADGAGRAGKSERARKILLAALGNASPDAVKDIVLYHQATHHGLNPLVSPPRCYEGDDTSSEWKRDRLTWAVSVGGDVLRGRLEGLLSR
ncbi:hypothetical protein FRB99_004033 [Tulasnella sp. 403]|nr:hypothetical protein FRB99_004033 [Tulasnella sp. 403]